MFIHANTSDGFRRQILHEESWHLSTMKISLMVSRRPRESTNVFPVIGAMFSHVNTSDGFRRQLLQEDDWHLSTIKTS